MTCNKMAAISLIAFHLPELTGRVGSAELGLVSQKSRDFFRPIRVPQFPLYLCNAEVLRHQTVRFLDIKLHNSSLFSYIKITLKDQLFKTSGLQFVNWLLRARKVLGTFGKEAPGNRL